MLKKWLSTCLIILGGAGLTLAQSEATVLFDESKLPGRADQVEKFVPSGWIIEDQIDGDLNNDATPDKALQLIEKQPAATPENESVNRARVLIVLFKTKNGEFERVATAKKLLQCTDCGGAFYGVVEAPANVSIAKGVLIAVQDHGSRNVVETTFRFRYDPAVKKIALIGFDLTDRDRVTGETVSESSNFLTGVKIKEVWQYSQKLDRDVQKLNRQTKISKSPRYLEDINYENFGND